MTSSLRKLAETGKWTELSAALGRLENLSACAELAGVLEEWGDTSVATNWLPLASSQYNAAMQCCMVVVYMSPDVEQRTLFGPLYSRMVEKLTETGKLLVQEHEADENGPLAWSSGTERVIQLGLQSRESEANRLLRRMEKLKAVASEERSRFAERLESGGDGPLLPPIRIWFYEAALEQLRRVGGGEAVSRIGEKLAALRPRLAGKPKVEPMVAHAEPEVALDDFVAEVKELARRLEIAAWEKRLDDPKVRPMLKSIGERFEALGDEAKGGREWSPAVHFYHVASTAVYACKTNRETILRKVKEAKQALVDERVAQPLGEEVSLADSKHWDRGMDWVERLALSGRFDEADRLMSSLERIPNAQRGVDSPGRFETIGDHLAESHPELALWFYQKNFDWVFRMPMETAAEGHMVNGMIAEARSKVGAAEARVAQSKRVAAIRIESSVQMHPSKMKGGGKERSSTQEIRHGGMLTLIAHPESPVSKDSPIQYAFRARIEKDEVWLTQMPDESGRTLAFSSYDRGGWRMDGNAISIRLSTNGSETIYYNAPVSGGPEWRLQLVRIT